MIEWRIRPQDPFDSLSLTFLCILFSLQNQGPPYFFSFPNVGLHAEVTAGDGIELAQQTDRSTSHDNLGIYYWLQFRETVYYAIEHLKKLYKPAQEIKQAHKNTLYIKKFSHRVNYSGLSI